MDTKPQTSVLFVCLGNICRSPLAHGVLHQVVAETGLGHRIAVDSAGTGDWHAGNLPDPRSMEVAARHGVDLSRQRARMIRPDDYSRFDLIFGMVRSNVEYLARSAPAGSTGSVHLFLKYATGRDVDIPDPYYGGPGGFDAVYLTIREASEALAAKLM